MHIICVCLKISPDGRRRICDTNPTCSKSVYSIHHQDQCTHTISQRRPETVIFATLSFGLPAHPLPYEERRPASRHRTNSWRKTKVTVVLLSQIVKSTCAKKACQHQNRVSYCLHRTPATLGKRYPHRSGFSPCYSATRTGASTQPLQAALSKKCYLFQVPVRKALRVRPEPIVEKTGLEPVTFRKPSGYATNCATSPKDLIPRERNDKR